MIVYCILPQLTLDLPHEFMSRMGHSMTAIALAPHLIEVTIFGGAQLLTVVLIIVLVGVRAWQQLLS